MAAQSVKSFPAIIVLPPDVMSGIAVGQGSAGTEPHPVEEPPKSASDLDKKQWMEVINTSGLLRAWKGQYNGENLSINRAPRAALKFRDSIPEFEVSDDSYTETQESTTRIEREMTLKAFTESGIHAALSGGAHGLTFGIGGTRTWSREGENVDAAVSATTTIHGFYNFPRVVVYLEPDSLELSEKCISFLKESGIPHLDNEKKDRLLEKFFQRFGGIMATRVTLGGRLCTAKEVRADEKTNIADEKRKLKAELTATIVAPAAGVDVGATHTRNLTTTDKAEAHSQTTRMTIETQGGNALLASNVTEWTTSIGGYQYWRVIQQSQPTELLSLLCLSAQGTDYHSDIVILQEHLENQAKLREQQRRRECEMWMNSTYSTIDHHGIFSFQMQIARPEIISLISVAMRLNKYWLTGRGYESEPIMSHGGGNEVRYEEFPNVKALLSWKVVVAMLEKPPAKPEPKPSKNVPPPQSDVLLHVTCDVRAQFFAKQGWSWDVQKTTPLLQLANTIDTNSVPRWSWKADGQRGPALEATWLVDGQDRKDHLICRVVPPNDTNATDKRQPIRQQKGVVTALLSGDAQVPKDATSKLPE